MAAGRRDGDRRRELRRLLLGQRRQAVPLRRGRGGQRQQRPGGGRRHNHEGERARRSGHFHPAQRDVPGGGWGEQGDFPDGCGQGTIALGGGSTLSFDFANDGDFTLSAKAGNTIAFGGEATPGGWVLGFGFRYGDGRLKVDARNSRSDNKSFSHRGTVNFGLSF